MRIARIAMRQIEDFAAYLRGHTEEFALEQFERLDRILATTLAQSPLTWGHFALTGLPYRAYLFRVGRRTHYWIIYTVDEESRAVDVLNFWNASRNPEIFDL